METCDLTWNLHHSHLFSLVHTKLENLDKQQQQRPFFQELSDKSRNSRSVSISEIRKTAALPVKLNYALKGKGDSCEVCSRAKDSRSGGRSRSRSPTERTLRISIVTDDAHGGPPLRLVSNSFESHMIILHGALINLT